MSDLRVIDLLGEEDIVDLLANAANQRNSIDLPGRDRDKARETIRGWKRRGRVSGLWYLPLWSLCQERNIKVTPDDFGTVETVPV